MFEENINLNHNDFFNIINEFWKIRKIYTRDKDKNIALNYSFRQVNNIMKNMKIEFADLTGKIYDLGMSVEVINDDILSRDSNLYITDMVEPIILLDNKIEKYGKVILSTEINGGINK